LWTEERSESCWLETMSSRRDLTSFHSCKNCFRRNLSFESCSSSVGAGIRKIEERGWERNARLLAWFWDWNWIPAWIYLALLF
jgi:hypothetical protein